MGDFTLEMFLVSVVVTWAIGLLPPVLIRFAFLKRPIGKWPALATCAFFWLFNFVLFTFLGSRSKTHTVLILIAMASYWILRKPQKAVASVPNEPGGEGA